MRSFKSIVKAVKAGTTAYKKSKADDLVAKAKKLKDKEAAAKKAKELKDAYNKGQEAGKIKGKKSVKRKIAATAVAAGAGYYEAKTGNLSKGASKIIKDLTKTSKPKPRVSMKEAVKDKKPVGFTKTGVVGKLKKGKRI
jgi:hypothetical protein